MFGPFPCACDSLDAASLLPSPSFDTASDGNSQADGVDCAGHVFRPGPTSCWQQDSKVLAVVHTKWKDLADVDRKKAVRQADVYQMMAYARFDRCPRLMLLYPARPAGQSGIMRRFGIHGGREMSSIAKVNVAAKANEVAKHLYDLMSAVGLLQTGARIAIAC